MTMKEFILGREIETEEEREHKLAMAARASEIAASKNADVTIRNSMPQKKMTLKEFVLGRETETTEEKLIKLE